MPKAQGKLDLILTRYHMAKSLMCSGMLNHHNLLLSMPLKVKYSLFN